ncbi:UrcA family protein [Maricaulis salignorans]|uniref:UrcA family protein n=1 Tax=Maricaulis salignorans TaxID=144026 RepID=UPI003A8CFD56
MMHSTRPFALAGAVFMLLGTAPAVQAQSANVFTFQTDQATLRTETGILETYERLVTQTGQYCEQFDLGAMSEQCETEVLAAAVAQVDSPGLAALHAARLAEQALRARQDAATPTS